MLFTIIDIETNGRSRESEVLEVGYMQVNHDLKIIRSGNLYFYRPNWVIENDAQEIHGLQRSFLEQYEKDFAGNMVRLYTLFQNSLLVGKNSDNFDVPTLKNFIRRYAPELGVVGPAGLLDMQKVYTKKFRNWYFDTYHITTRKMGTLSQLIALLGYSQDDVLELFKQDLGGCEGREQAHSALYDVYMTYLLLKHAVEANEIQIINKTGKSNDELMWEDTQKNVDDLLEDVLNKRGLDATKYWLTVSECFEHYNVDSSFVDYMPSEFVTLTEMLLQDELAKALAELNVGTRGFSRVGDKYSIDSRKLSYWFTNIFLKTGDEIFLKLIKVVLAHCDFIPERLMNFEGEAFSLDQELYGRSAISAYVSYSNFKQDKWGLKPIVDINNSEIVSLFRSDRQAFWKKAIPNTNMLFAELCCGMLAKDAASIYGMFILFNERGGI